MPAIPIGTITLYYESHGHGEPLVLLPDLGNDVTSLWGQVPQLSQELRCIAIDNRGVGRSSKPSSPYTTKLMAEDTVQVLNYLHIEKAHFFGASLGGAIAQEIALNHPDRVAKLVILGGWSRPDRYLTSLFELFRDVKRSVDPLTFDREVALWSFTRGYFDSSYDELEKRQRAALDVPYPTPPTTFTRQAEAAMAHNTYDRIEQISAPTLLLVGEADIFTPRTFSQEMSEKIPNGTLQVIAGAAHAAYWERPEEVTRAILDFIEPVKADTDGEADQSVGAAASAVS